MEQKSFFHLCADGADALNFIISQDDFLAAFNLFGACAANTDVEVLAESIEETHPHALLHGTRSECAKFTGMYDSSYSRHIISTRGNKDSVTLNWTLYEVDDRSYLMNVGTYIVSQPTKDGKRIMPYDYLYGTGSMYFRPEDHIPIWCTIGGVYTPPRLIGNLTCDERRAILHSKMTVPDSWKTCNGFLLPNNYIAIKSFEDIYKTANCFRTFMANGRNKEDSIIQKLAAERGVMMNDIEVRAQCGVIAKTKFGIKDVRRLTAVQRLELAIELRRSLRVSVRQIASVVRLPITEIEKYIR